MKIQNRRTKPTIAIVASFIMGLIMFSPTTVFPSVGATSDILSPDCMDKAAKIELQLASQLDEAKAKSIASSHNEFAIKTLGKSVTFDSVYNTWTIDRTTCNPTWDTTNVVYRTSDVNGKNVHDLVFTMDPQLTKVMKINEREITTSYSTTKYNKIWAGYEFAGDSTLTTTVTNSHASFSVPTVSKPTGFNCYISGTTEDCELAVWTGLMDNYGGTAQYLVQTGATAIRSCDSSGNNCTSPDNMWYEYVYPGSSGGGTVCTGLTVSAGDSMTASVTQDSVNALKYNTNISDANTGHSCTGSITTSMNSPRVATFIDERPTHVIDNKLDPLPVFSTNSITGGLTLRGTTSETMYVPYSNGYYQYDRMTTDGTSGTHELITESTVGNTGSFTWTYQFSS
jgi:hypothetical protein